MSNNFSIGRAIRDLRRQHNLTAEQLGKRVGISQPRISKIETGVDANPKPEVIEKILHMLDAPQTIRQQVSANLGTGGTVRLQRYTTNKPFAEILEQERKARTVTVYSMSLIPALLQTIEYQEALHKRHGATAKQLQVKLQTIARRQDLLWERKRRYHFVLHETALYTLAGAPSIQLAQLDRIDRLSEMPNVKLGIIPTQAGAAPVDNGPFAIYDDRKVRIGVASADIPSKDADEVATYRSIFHELDNLADYGDSAHELIHKAMDYFG